MIRAGWAVDKIVGFPQVESGVTIFYDEKNVPAGVFQLFSLLEKYHVDVQRRPGSGGGSAKRFSVFVGKRPQF